MNIMIVGVGGQGTLLASRIIGQATLATGADVKLSSFVRFAKGEGIEKKVDDFAAEIASMVK